MKTIMIIAGIVVVMLFYILMYSLAVVSSQADAAIEQQMLEEKDKGN